MYQASKLLVHVGTSSSMKEVRELQCSRWCVNEFPVYPLPGFYDIALVELFFTEPPTAHKAMAPRERRRRAISPNNVDNISVTLAS